jgi:Spy/CpxP family protein refolding chaperone
MKKLLATAMLALLSTAALAERPHGPGGNFFGQLDLSDEQKSQIQELRKNGANREEIRSVLNADQLAKLEELRGQGREPRGKNLDRMQEHLDLSDQQVEEMRSIIEAGGTREEVHEVLTDEQREKLKEAKAHRPYKGGKGE